MDVLVYTVLILTHVVSGQDVVNTTSGLVRGDWKQSLGVIQFLGIPYAEPPEGGLRFKPPVRKNRIEGIYNATSNTRVCLQSTSNLAPTISPTEDCLRLDIYVPRNQSLVEEPARFPVMIWIHGGGYFIGSSASYDASPIAKKGQVIVVVVNYRLGFLGFLNTMDENSVGNFGLRDQCSAIEWVVDNIGEFGGDVTRVTIFGESAGSSSVMQLAMSSLCKGKFHRVIAQSGSPEAPWAYNKDPLESSKKLAKLMDCPPESEALIICLRNKTKEEFLKLENLTFSIFGGNDWVPSYTSDVFPDNPLDILRGIDSDGLRRFRSLDLMTGLCREEAELFFIFEIAGFLVTSFNESKAILSESVFQSKLRKAVTTYRGLRPDEMDRLYPAFKFQYTEWDKLSDEFSRARSLIQLYGDIAFNVGTIAFAKLHSGKNPLTDPGTTYLYQLRPKPSYQKTYPWSQGATHTDDIPFLFDFINGTAPEGQLSDEIVEYWTNFAKSGSPNKPSLTMSEPVWPMYNGETGAYMQLDLNLNNDSIDAFPYARRIAFWEELFNSELNRIRDDRKERNRNKCPQDGDGNKCPQDGDGNKCPQDGDGNGTNSAIPTSRMSQMEVVLFVIMVSCLNAIRN